MTGDIKLKKAVCARPENWPAAEQLAWTKATTKRAGPFRHNGGRLPGPYSLRAMASGYGRWITFLNESGQLDPDEAPAARPTPERLDAYFCDLRACGNRDYTVLGRFEELKNALTLMCPGEDFGWITRPNGVSIRSMLPMEAKQRPTPDSAALLAWAVELFDAALLLHKPRCRRAQVREAVMIGILAVLAPRVRALSALEIGVHLHHQDEEWILDQRRGILKAGPELEMPLPPEVARMLERYLAVERLEWLGDGKSDALWISARGAPLAQETIMRRIRLRTQKRFGVAFGPHAFRASLATKLALDSPENPLDASAILGHRSPSTTLKHYNRANAVAASRRHASWLAEFRRQTEGVAGRLFPEREAE
jgi:integrase